MKQTVLVTGGTGFLGSALARALLADGFSVRLFGRDFSRVDNLLAAGGERFSGDLRDSDTVARAVCGADFVVHCGALSAPWGKRSDFFSVNVDGTRHVVDACVRHDVARLVHVSSPSVVFNGENHENLPDSAPIAKRFASVYSESKARAETVVRDAGGSLRWIIVRPKAIYGPGDTTLLPRLIDAARAGRLPRLGDGENRIDLTFIDDAARSLLCALNANDDACGKTFTITSGESVRIWAIVARLLHGLDIPWEPRPLPENAALLAASLMELAARITGREPRLTRYTVKILCKTQTHDITPARRLLNYEPRVTIDDGLARTIAALRNEVPAR